MMNFQDINGIAIPAGETSMLSMDGMTLWQKMKSRLPYEYQEVEWIQGTGTQYIDTGMYAPLNTDIEVKFQLNSETNGAIFGGRTAQTAQTCTLFYLATAKPPYFRFDRTSQKTVADSNQISIDTESVYEFSYKDNVATITNLTTEESNSVYIGTPSSFTGNPIHLFAVTGGTLFDGKIFGWKYWENGELIQHFIPCYRKSDGEVGMYDLVSEMFFANRGTGEFYCEKPKYKAELEYIESTGTQWIDTGMTIDTASDTVELMFQNTGDTVYKWFFGEHDNNARLGLGTP